MIPQAHDILRDPNYLQIYFLRLYCFFFMLFPDTFFSLYIDFYALFKKLLGFIRGFIILRICKVPDSFMID